MLCSYTRWTAGLAYVTMQVAAVMAAYDYGEVLGMSFLFYEAQRSGKLPSHRVTWRMDALMNDQLRGETLAGGYHDAGDHTKFTFPMAFAMTQLAWGMLEFRTGYAAAEQTEYGKEAIKWGLDWLLLASPFDDDQLVVLVGDVIQEHAQWTRPEDDYLRRPVTTVDARNPGTDAWCAVAAALAAGSLVFRADDTDYSAKLLDRAVKLYGYAEKYRGLYSDQLNTTQYYVSTKYDDDLAWASIWLWQATSREQYLNDTVTRFKTAANNRWVFVDVPAGGSCTRGNTCYWTGTRVWNWDNMYPGVMIMLTAEKTGIEDIVWQQVDRWLTAWMRGDAMMRRTAKGLSCARCDKCGWGATRNAANAAYLALVAAKFTRDTAKRDSYRCWAQQQIDYLLGDGGRSLVVGYGNQPPNQPHHRAASCPDALTPCNWDVFNQKKPNVHILEGALVSGQCNDTFVDDIANYQTNEVALDMNSGFTGALAALVDPRNRCNNVRRPGDVRNDRRSDGVALGGR